VSGLPAAQQQAFLDAVDQLLRTARRSPEQLAPFIRRAVRLSRDGADAAAYLEAVGILARRRMSAAAFARLGENALGSHAIDLVWLGRTSLRTDDLEFMLLDPNTQWARFARASADPRNVPLLRAALVRARGVASEMVARDEAAALVPGFRVQARQVRAGTSDIDFQMVSTDRLGRTVGLEVKGWTRRGFRESMDAYGRRQAGEVLTTQSDIRGAKEVERMLRQLRDARAITHASERPVLAVSDALREAERRILRDLLDDAGLDVAIVYLPESQILGVGRRLGAAMGFR
jgi:hypothetical protein